MILLTVIYTRDTRDDIQGHVFQYKCRKNAARDVGKKPHKSLVFPYQYGFMYVNIRIPRKDYSRILLSFQRYINYGTYMQQFYGNFNLWE